MELDGLSNTSIQCSNCATSASRIIYNSVGRRIVFLLLWLSEGHKFGRVQRSVVDSQQSVDGGHQWCKNQSEFRILRTRQRFWKRCSKYTMRSTASINIDSFIYSLAYFKERSLGLLAMLITSCQYALSALRQQSLSMAESYSYGEATSQQSVISV